MNIDIKRVYEPAAEGDGRRILVDRLWPRGLARERVGLDEWMKDIAPSAALRRWFGHLPENFAPFSEMYRRELDADPVKAAAVLRLLEMAKSADVTLLYAARSEAVNHAAVLRDYLMARM